MEKFQKITEFKELDLYSIEMADDGKKQIHISGYTYWGDQCELAEICWFIEPLDEFIEHIKEDNCYVNTEMGDYKQYIGDYTEDEICECVNTYFDGKPADYDLHYSEITMDTPCGNYVCIFN